jgi:hypothetical protein
MNLRKHISPHGRVTAVSMMKDEAPYLLEWFAHHLAVGFTDILVYTNDCTDGTSEMLIRLEELGLGHHRRNVIAEGNKPQPSALKYAQKEPIVQNSDWVIVLDADEFLVVRYGDGRIDSVLEAAKGFDGIVITWRIFGSGSVEDWSSEPVTEQYQQAAPDSWNKGWGVKTLFKFDHEKWKLGIHRPSMKAKVLDTEYPTTINWLNGSGLPMEDYFKFRGWRSIRRTVGYGWLQMNHYAVKSMDAYAIRRLRGNVNNKADKYNTDYWALQDRNEVHEPSISRHFDKRREIMDELLKDPVLSKLHHDAIDTVEARLAAIRKTDDYAGLKIDLHEASKVNINDVSAKPHKARDASKIAEMMSNIETRVAGKPKMQRRTKAEEVVPASADRGLNYNPSPISWTTNVDISYHANHDIDLPADPKIFTPNALDDVANGKFDRKNARWISGLIEPNDRMLNVGSGVCFIPMVCCKFYPDLVVLAHENRKDLNSIAEEIITRNGIDLGPQIKIIDGSLQFASDQENEASGLQAYIKDFNPDVLRLCDDRVTPDILGSLTLGSLRRIILTTLDPENDATVIARIKQLQPNFVSNSDKAKAGFTVLDRKTT